MAPGRRWRPVASNVSRAVGIARFSPIARIRPSLIATAASNEAVSVTIVAPEITRSAKDVVGFVISLGPFDGVVATFSVCDDSNAIRSHRVLFFSLAGATRFQRQRIRLLLRALQYGRAFAAPRQRTNASRTRSSADPWESFRLDPDGICS